MGKRLGRITCGAALDRARIWITCVDRCGSKTAEAALTIIMINAIILIIMKGVKMESISAVEARKGLGMLLNRVHLRHESFIIERAGKKIAILQAYKADGLSSDTTGGGRIPEGKLDIRDMAGLGSDIWKSVNSDEYVASERAEWS